MAGGAGPIQQPWKTKEEVPKSVWEGHKWAYPRWTDEEYLDALNDTYYYSFYKSGKLAKGRFSGQKGITVCFICDKYIILPERLCKTCKVRVRRNGEVHVAGGVSVVHVGGPNG